MGSKSPRNHRRREGEDPLRRISLYIPEPYLEGLDLLVTAQLYPHRSEAIRLAIRDLLLEETGLKRN